VIPVSLGLAVGVVLGLLVGAKARRTLRQERNEAAALVVMFNSSAVSDDRAEVGPITPARGTVVGDDLDPEPFMADSGYRAPIFRRPAGSGLHVSRGWHADPFAPGCGCVLAHCGLVIPQSGCAQHDNGKTFRLAHRVEDCPVYADPVEDDSSDGPRTVPGKVTD